jgi:hypothetical protein
LARRSPSARAGLAVPAVLLGLSGLLILALGGCDSDKKRLERLRARYRVEVDGFMVEQRPMAVSPAPVLAQDVRVDLLITDTAAAEERDDRPEPMRLPVELALTGPGGAVRGRWPAVLEVAAPATGDEPLRASYHLEAVPFQPGDLFTVAIAEVTESGESDGEDGAGEDAGRP